MIRLATLGWWLVLLVLLPVLLVQAVHARRRAIRLEPASGAQSGRAGAGNARPLHVLLLGESTVAGVGVTTQEEALAGQFAAGLAGQTGRPVIWQALGENGIAATQACERLLPQVADRQFDLVLLVFGVNDTTHFTSRQRWETALARLAQAFAGPECLVAFTAVPPMQHFSALPGLLRHVLGWRAALLDRQMRAVAARLAAEHCPVSLEFTSAYLAVDGYHPSALGYRVWAKGLSDLLAGRFRD